MKFKLSFTNKEITPWGGMVFLNPILHKMEFLWQKLREKSKTIGKTLSLFPKDKLYQSYRYSVYRTNQKCSASGVWCTLRYRVFATSIYFEKYGDQVKLIIALAKKRKKWFKGIWDYLLNLKHLIWV